MAFFPGDPLLRKYYGNSTSFFFLSIFCCCCCNFFHRVVVWSSSEKKIQGEETARSFGRALRTRKSSVSLFFSLWVVASSTSRQCLLFSVYRTQSRKQKNGGREKIEINKNTKEKEEEDKNQLSHESRAIYIAGRLQRQRGSSIDERARTHRSLLLLENITR